MYEGLAPGRRADRGNVRRSIGRRADGGRQRAKAEGGWRMADGEKFLLRFSNTPLFHCFKSQNYANKCDIA